MLLVSIIVPLHNKEKYIEKCIESISSQTYKDIEIIIVNDGSTDNSLSICNELAAQDGRICIISQDNGGLAYSRKVGVENSKGEYIAFVDADDYIASDMIAKMVQRSKSNKADIVACNLYRAKKNGLESNPFLISDGYYEADDKRLLQFYFHMGDAIPTLHNVCEKLIRRTKFLQIMDYVPNTVSVGEDLFFSYMLLQVVNGIEVLNEPLYFYRILEQSMAHEQKNGELAAIESLYDKLVDAVSKLPSCDRNLTKGVESFFSTWITSVFSKKCHEFSPMNYVFPYDCVKPNAKVILYGMGDVGQSYLRQMNNSNYSRIVGCIDSRETPYVTMSISDINQIDCDIILICVKTEKNALDIRNTLLEANVDNGKIVWKLPRVLI